MNQKQLENWKQDGSSSVTSRQKIQVLKEKKNSEKKEEKGIKKNNVVDTQCKSNINTAVEEHSSPENTYKTWYCCQSRMIKYFQPVFKPSNKLKLLKK